MSWSLLIAGGMVGSGAGIALTQPVETQAVAEQRPAGQAGRTGAMRLPDIYAIHRSSGGDEFIRAQVRAQAASREPFAIFRAATPRQ